MYSSSHSRSRSSMYSSKQPIHKKPRQLHLQDDEELNQLRDRLIETHDFEGINNRKLLAIQQNVRQAKKSMMAYTSFVKARDLFTLDDEISEEFHRREEEKETQKQRDIYSNPKIVNYDQETQAGLEQMQTRHAKLMDSLDTIWNQKMQPHYFEPSKKLTQMQDQLKKNPNDKELADQIDEMYMQEMEMAEVNYETDYLKARMKLEAKQKSEIQSYYNKRMKQRQIILAEIRPVQPYNLRNVHERKSVPVKRPNLLSYAHMAHKKSPVVPVVQKSSISTISRSMNTTKTRNNNKKKALPNFFETSVQADFQDKEEDYIYDEENATGGNSEVNNNHQEEEEIEVIIEEEEEEEVYEYEEEEIQPKKPNLNVPIANNVTFKKTRARSARDDRPRVSAKYENIVEPNNTIVPPQNNENREVSPLFAPQNSNEENNETIIYEEEEEEEEAIVVEEEENGENGDIMEEEEAQNEDRENGQEKGVTVLGDVIKDALTEQKNEEEDPENYPQPMDPEDGNKDIESKNDSLAPSPRNEEAEVDSLGPSPRNEEAEVDSLGPSPRNEEAEVDSLGPSPRNEEAEVDSLGPSPRNEEAEVDSLGPSPRNEEAEVDSLGPSPRNKEAEVDSLGPENDEENVESPVIGDVIKDTFTNNIDKADIASREIENETKEEENENKEEENENKEEENENKEVGKLQDTVGGIFGALTGNEEGKEPEVVDRSLNKEEDENYEKDHNNEAKNESDLLQPLPEDENDKSQEKKENKLSDDKDSLKAESEIEDKDSLNADSKSGSSSDKDKTESESSKSHKSDIQSLKAESESEKEEKDSLKAESDHDSEHSESENEKENSEKKESKQNTSPGKVQLAESSAQTDGDNDK